ncbi:MAG: MptD family putative ECF transporter S component [Bacteroidales bacterium]|nr:MptD family putative ECF transporter S component [Bacteroidales bacterium]
MSIKSTFHIFISAIGYLAMFLLGATSGIIHPACYAYIGAIMPLFFACVYLYVAANLRCFGTATILNGFLFVVGLLTGEADATFIVGIILLTAFAEIIRFLYSYDTLKGVRWSFVPFAFSFFAYTAHWWTDTEGSLAAAVEEMPAGYDELMKPVIDNIPVLIVVLILTIPVAILGMRIAEKLLKKQAAKFKE